MNKIEKYVNEQQTLQHYPKFKKSLIKVLERLSDKELLFIKNKVIFMVIHEGALAQVMHFKKRNDFKIAQFTFPEKIPSEILNFVIAHELGHVMQNRNWTKNDGTKLEDDADSFAKRIGFSRTKKINDWINIHRTKTRKIRF